jgi:cytochrome P450
MTPEQKSKQFPLGARIGLEELSADPYVAYSRLRSAEPLSWLPALNMWYVTRYADVRRILLDPELFTTHWPGSTIQDTFGVHMLTSEGAQHDRYRRPAQPFFSPKAIREALEGRMSSLATRLIEDFAQAGTVDLRQAFASRLPIQTMLVMLGIPLDCEQNVRRWYDSFEAALANFTGDEAIREEAHRNVRSFHRLIDTAVAEARSRNTDTTLLSALLHAPDEQKLSDDEIRRNLSIIFFGGISTVEALILNALWALFHHPEISQRVRADFGLLPRVLDETMRWLSPVQSATRHVTKDILFEGHQLRRGDTVNCMLGAANHDPAIFPNPEQFDIDRFNLGAHLGFATGPHACLGFRLAKAEASIAISQLLTLLPALALDRENSTPPEGFEFRQSRRLVVKWDQPNQVCAGK